MERLVSRRRPLTDLPIAGRDRKLTGRFSVTNDGEDDHGGLYDFDRGDVRKECGRLDKYDGWLQEG